MNKEDYVSLEVAKLLKEKGFNELCYTAYDKDGRSFNYKEIRLNWNGEYDWAYSRPTLYHAQKWLRLNKNIHVCVDVNASGWYYVLSKSDNGTYVCDSDENGPNDGGCWDTYEEALDNGIFMALKLI